MATQTSTNGVSAPNQRPRRDWSTKIPPGRWDYIVIGSGMGGMTTAALLAKLGKRVLVLEQHYVPGGFTHAFKRKSWEWDVGVHAVGEVTRHSMTGRLLDKLTDVYNSGTTHEEHQPAHLKIVDTEVCATTCKEEYGNPCTKFCPAQVYNMVENEASGRLEMQVDFSNCVHCKTCDIRDPYQVITWVPPEGGQGPEYGFM